MEYEPDDDNLTIHLIDHEEFSRQVKALDEQTAYERFRSSVNLAPDPVNGCLEWRGELDAAGYGTFWNGYRRELVHEFAYRHVLLESERLPLGATVTQCCGFRRCVRLDHLKAS